MYFTFFHAQNNLNSFHFTQLENEIQLRPTVLEKKDGCQICVNKLGDQLFGLI